MNIKNEVSKTMLIPLYHKMSETIRFYDKKDSILIDEKAYEICKGLDYDFSIYENDLFSKIGCCVRANFFDEMVINFIKNHKNSVVINAGCGLDSRYERVALKLKNLDNVYFYNIDLEDVINVRKKYFKDSKNCFSISANILDFNWIKDIKNKHENADFIVITEGVLMYLDNEEIKKYINNLMCLEKFEFWCDFLGSKFYRNKNRHKTLKKLDVEIKSCFDSEDDFSSLVDFANVKHIKSLMYFRAFRSRWGFLGIVLSLLPSSFLKKFSFMAGFYISKK